MIRVGQNCTYTLYMTLYSMNSLPKIPYIHRKCMVLANPTQEPPSSTVSAPLVLARRVVAVC